MQNLTKISSNTVNMNELVDQLNIDFSDNFSLHTYLLSIIICALLLYLLSVIYIRFGKSISNRHQLARVLILVGITTFIIISIVKSSLALSLGLVGALSIVRFRTAIKEPEELGYFFIAISIGLGMGANQLLPTLIGFLVLVAVIVVLNKKAIKSSFSQNIVVSLKCEREKKSAMTNKISEIITATANQVDLKNMKFFDDRINLNFLVNVASLNQINEINESLLKLDDKMDISFIDGEF